MPDALGPAEESLVQGVLEGKPRALSRVLSLIEDETPEGRAILDRLFPSTGRAYRIGITGAPGSGKSTLTDLLTRLILKEGGTVGILAVDPSSPFTGGAILGDRIRMPHLATEPSVFIRSMASRGSLGGIAASTEQAAEAMDAFGCSWILIETVGVGQSEMEIVGVADTTLLVLVPESGDGIQMMKAGLMEAGDIFVINKYDREGGDKVHREVGSLLEVLHDRMPADAWVPPIVPTVAMKGEGGEDLLTAIRRHREWREGDPVRGEAIRRAREAERIRTLLRARIVESAWTLCDVERRLKERTPAVTRRELSPYRLVDNLVEECCGRLASLGAGPGGDRT